MTRDKAFEAFLAAVIVAVPETGDDWPERRALLRDAAVTYCRAAVADLIERTWPTCSTSTSPPS